MMNANLQKAKWVSANKEYCSPLLRKEFELHNIEKATITIAVLGFFEGYINGKSISEDMFLPLYTDFHKRPPIDYCGHMFEEELAYRLYCPVYDITQLLSDGVNTIGFILAPGRYERPHDNCGYGYVKMAFCIEALHRDGTKEYIVSDEGMKRREGFVKKCDILNGEAIDFTGYDDNWTLAGFDASMWQPVALEEAPDTRFFVQDCPADRVIRHNKCTLVNEKDGVRIYDVGEIMSGYPIFAVKEGYKGEINIRYGELLNEDCRLNEDNIYLQHTDIMTDGRKRLVHSRFTWMCFRYFEVRGEAEPVDCVVIHSDIAVSSAFSCDDEILNWLYDAYIRTQLANMHNGIPSDCPHIERKGYTGDGQLTCKAAMMLLDSQKFYKKWIYDISDCQDRKTGHVQYTAPFLTAGGGPGGWGGAIVFVPFEYYRQYKDASILKELYPQMLRYFDFMEAHSENELVTSDIEGCWCLGDWCVPEQLILNEKNGIKIPPAYVNTYFYIKAMQIVLKIEEIIGERSEYLKDRIERKKAALVRSYFDDETGNFCKNLQGGNVFAVDLGIGDERTLLNMVEHYRKTGHYDTGIFGTYIVTRLLFEKGFADVALSILTSKDVVSFHNQKKTGATTILENWNGVRSQCHPMFGAVSDCLPEYILGIRQQEDSAAYESIIIEPKCMEQIPFAAGYITTVKGKISVKYNEKEIYISVPDEVKLEVKAGNRCVFLEKGSISK